MNEEDGRCQTLGVKAEDRRQESEGGATAKAVKRSGLEPIEILNRRTQSFDDPGKKVIVQRFRRV
jgi:hypothetical protein